MPISNVITTINPTYPALNANTAIQINGIDCSDEGTVESFDDSGINCVRTIRCKWQDRLLLASFLRGATFGVPNANAAPINLGQPYPDAPGAYVFRIDITGNGQIGRNLFTGMVAYEYAVLKVYYRSGFTPFENGSISFEYGMRARSFVTSQDYLEWASGADTGVTIPVRDSPPLILPIINIRRTLNRVTKFPKAALDAAAIAPVNSTTLVIDSASFRIPGSISLEDFNNNQSGFGGTFGNLTGMGNVPTGGGYGAGKVLFSGASCRKSDVVGGFTFWNIEFAFEASPLIGYDETINPRTSAITKFRKKDGNPLIPQSDLNLLFAIS